jgi:hypothetical protein
MGDIRQVLPHMDWARKRDGYAVPTNGRVILPVDKSRDEARVALGTGRDDIHTNIHTHLTYYRYTLQGMSGFVDRQLWHVVECR